VAGSRVELFSTARMEGDLDTPDLVMESGCVYNGTCRMRAKGRPDEPRVSAAVLWLFVCVSALLAAQDKPDAL